LDQITVAEEVKVLYVDDEPDNLVGFKASFRFKYRVFTAVNVPQALDILKQHPDIKVVFCDQRMPGITGVEFFEQIRVEYPKPIRILLTAYTDSNSIIDAINKGQIFRYVHKPWNENEIVSAIDEATKFYLANTMLAVKNDELQKAYDELNKFAYSISHDIRGPILAIAGAIDVAGDIDDVNEMKQMLNLMKKSLSKLDTYILSMHDYYSLQRGELKVRDIDFNELIEELKQIYSIVAETNNVTFNASVCQKESFRSDEGALKLILGNLVSNAFKYQNKNHDLKAVEVKVEVEKSKAVISIKDTGIGILGSHIGEIFNLFYRANAQEPGSGLGLYNVKSALLKLDGQIEVNSIMHQGSTFIVTIPSA
jgi:two-component system, sensor histidine kinase and response regulator